MVVTLPAPRVAASEMPLSPVVDSRLPNTVQIFITTRTSTSLVSSYGNAAGNQPACSVLCRSLYGPALTRSRSTWWHTEAVRGHAYQFRALFCFSSVFQLSLCQLPCLHCPT